MDKYTLRELQAIAKERNIKGCTKYRKSELAQMLGIDLNEGKRKQNRRGTWKPKLPKGNGKQRTGEASTPPKIPLLSKGKRKQNRRGTLEPRLPKGNKKQKTGEASTPPKIPLLSKGNGKQRTGDASTAPKIPLLSKGKQKQNRRGTWEPRLPKGNKKQKAGEASTPPKIPLLSKGKRKQNRRWTLKPQLSKVMTRSASKSKKQPDWLDLPSDVMLNILSRIGVAEILWNVQIVCTKWHAICKDPCMWRVIYMDRDVYSNHKPYDWPSCLPDSALSFKGARQICEMIVERSQGQLVDITIVECCDDELLQYVVDRSSQLRRLTIAYSYESISDEGFTQALKKLPLLEELSVYNTSFSQKNIEALGSYCLLLKRLKLNYTQKRPGREYPKVIVQNRELPEVIVQNLPQLTHLELNWLSLMDSGLKTILDGCRHLQLLDLRMCKPISLEGELRKRCLEQIKCVKLPTDPIKCLPYSDCEHSFEMNGCGKIFRMEGILRLLG